MVQSKLISGVIAKLKVAYSYYFKEINDEEFILLTQMYQNQLAEYIPEIVLKSIDKIISTSKFMPTIAEIINKCEEEKNNFMNEIVKKMIDDNYFKSTSEIDKATHWLEEGVIPKWFKKDMKKYGYSEVSNQLKNSDSKLLLGITE